MSLIIADMRSSYSTVGFVSGDFAQYSCCKCSHAVDFVRRVSLSYVDIAFVASHSTALAT